MTISKNTLREDWHRADIQCAVNKCCGSLSRLSRMNGLASGTLANALVRSWFKGEQIIANAIGVSAEEIWPSRYYAPDGKKIVRQRAKKSET